MYRQLSFFTAGEQPAIVDDVDGVLAGPGQLVRRRGAARLGLLVDARWRAEALVEELAIRSLVAGSDIREDGWLRVHTEFEQVLLPVAERWTRGASRCPPDDLVLDGPRLRLWSIAAGRADRFGYLLPVGAGDDRAWPLLGSALARAGTPAALLGPRAGGPAFRVTGARRLTRLRELVGDPPEDVGPDWPRAEIDGDAR